jgi:tRNA G37 N-methylase Trm5
MKHLWVVGFFLVIFSCSQGKSDKQEPKTPEPATENPANDNDAGLDREQEVVTPDDAERTDWQNPELVLQMLGDLEGKVVADIGAGSGYFSFKIARKAKKVIALDIDPRALDYIKEQIEIVGDWSKNIEPRLTPADVPNLLQAEADVVLIVNTYGFIPDKKTYLPRVLNGIKPGGKLVIVDFKAGAIPVGPSDEFKVKVAEAVRTLKETGFHNISKDEKSLEYQYIITAEK